jgi:ribosomal protein S18 acetylase RimI-like enzyme
VFRHPDAAPAGTGAALIGAAITSLHHGGERSLGLIVTDGNPARGVYERLGFAVTRVSVSVRIGAADRAAGD